MKQYLLKIAGMAAMVLALHSTGSAQPGEDRDEPSNKLGENDEIVIKPKGDVDLDVKIKGGKVFINGKPVDQFVDDSVSVHKKRMMVMDGRNFSFRGPAGAMALDEMGEHRPRFHENGRTPDGREWNMNGEYANQAFLGVSTIKTEEGADGAKVKEVTKGSAAEKAGLKEDDLITRVDEINIKTPEDLSNAIHKYKPQDKVTLTYKRGGKEQKTTVTLGKSEMKFNYNYNFTMPGSEDLNFTMPPMPETPGGPRAFSWNDDRPKLGIKAQDMDEGKGARVLDVDDESAAEKADIKEGDIITRFDGKDVENASMLADLARETKGKPSIKIGLTREGKTMEVEVKVPKKLKTADL